MKKLILSAIAIISFSTFALSQDQKAEEQSITSAITTMQNGWNEKSGEKFASIFADNHDFIVWNGYYFRNTTKAMTGTSHHGLFHGPFKMVDLKLKVDKIKFIRPDIALAHVFGVSYTTGTAIPKDPSVLMTMLFEKKNGNWQVISFHNLDLEAFQSKEIGDRSPMPLNVMYASWYNN